MTSDVACHFVHLCDLLYDISVAVNCTAPTLAADMPYGGTKQSGMGRELGPNALDAWLESKAVFVKVSGKPL